MEPQSVLCGDVMNYTNVCITVVSCLEDSPFFPSFPSSSSLQ